MSRSVLLAVLPFRYLENHFRQYREASQDLRGDCTVSETSTGDSRLEERFASNVVRPPANKGLGYWDARKYNTCPPTFRGGGSTLPTIGCQARAGLVILFHTLRIQAPPSSICKRLSA